MIRSGNVCSANSKELHRHLVFREFLRQNPEAVKRYSAVKEQAARLFPEDIEGYMGDIRHRVSKNCTVCVGWNHKM